MISEQFSAGAAVYDYTWDAVADPRDSTKKVIGATQRSKRNAIPAVVLTLMPAGSPDSEWRPGLDFGVSLNKDRVFLSLGGSIQVASFLRVGASWVHHRVKQLQSPQKAMEFNADGSFIKDSLTPVTTSADIRMIDGKDDGLQFTVAITLDKLNPFK